MKLSAVEAVAAWLLEVAQTTQSAPERLEPERRRLGEDVLPHWTRLGADNDLVNGLDAIPAVFEHRDLGSWNLVAAGERFTAVDWESSLRDGLPLWDLLYFLTDALAHLDGASPLERRAEHADPPPPRRARLVGGPLLMGATDRGCARHPPALGGAARHVVLASPRRVAHRQARHLGVHRPEHVRNRPLPGRNRWPVVDRSGSWARVGGLAIPMTAPTLAELRALRQGGAS